MKPETIAVHGGTNVDMSSGAVADARVWERTSTAALFPTKDQPVSWRGVLRWGCARLPIASMANAQPFTDVGHSQHRQSEGPNRISRIAGTTIMFPPMDPRYPIGKYQRPTSVDAATLQSAVNAIAAAPAQLSAAVQGAHRRTTRHAVSRRRMDRAAGHPSRPGESLERLHAM
jgi:hypothetical protein